MLWAKKRCDGIEYIPYREFMLVSVKVKGLVEDFYLGLPDKSYLPLFDGFEAVDESSVPKVVDTLHIADNNEFKRRFTFRHDLT